MAIEDLRDVEASQKAGTAAQAKIIEARSTMATILFVAGNIGLAYGQAELERRLPAGSLEKGGAELGAILAREALEDAVRRTRGD